MCRFQILAHKERQEVDFALVHNEWIEKIIDVKTADHSIAPSLPLFP
jgi:hypothetical protein